MYRRNAAQTPRRDTLALIARATMGAIGGMISRVLGWTDVYDVAWRENRRRDRFSHREFRHSRYRAMGCGKRECDRRKRQIAAGQLTVSNGLDLSNSWRRKAAA